jgi:hypothetical protein
MPSLPVKDAGENLLHGGEGYPADRPDVGRDSAGVGWKGSIDP